LIPKRPTGHRIRADCVNLDGSVTGEHGIGVEKLDFVPRLFTPEDLAMMIIVVRRRHS
jgi:glycolate oxidase